MCVCVCVSCVCLSHSVCVCVCRGIYVLLAISLYLLVLFMQHSTTNRRSVNSTGYNFAFSLPAIDSLLNVVYESQDVFLRLSYSSCPLC